MSGHRGAEKVGQRAVEESVKGFRGQLRTIRAHARNHREHERMRSVVQNRGVTVITNELSSDCGRKSEEILVLLQTQSWGVLLSSTSGTLFLITSNHSCAKDKPTIHLKRTSALTNIDDDHCR